MKRTIVTTTALAFAFAAASPLFASGTSATKKAEEVCKEQAKKEHIGHSNMQAYMKTCVEKHQQTTSGTQPPPAK